MCNRINSGPFLFWTNCWRSTLFHLSGWNNLGMNWISWFWHGFLSYWSEFYFELIKKCSLCFYLFYFRVSFKCCGRKLAFNNKKCRKKFAYVIFMNEFAFKLQNNYNKAKLKLSVNQCRFFRRKCEECWSKN